jgi:hypothetical protein
MARTYFFRAGPPADVISVSAMDQKPKLFEQPVIDLPDAEATRFLVN